MVAKTKPWRKSLSKRETWKNGHSYNVIRSAEGTFVKVHKIRAYHYREAPKKRGISYARARYSLTASSSFVAVLI